LGRRFKSSGIVNVSLSIRAVSAFIFVAAMRAARLASSTTVMPADPLET
jgi:hypothetical protein